MTRSRATADTQDNNGGSVAPFVAGKNRIINGNMNVDQRFSGATSSSNGYTLDRWTCFRTTTNGGTFTTQQVADAPSGFTYSLKASNVTNSTASTVWIYQQWVEGYNVQDFNMGSASAVTFTLSFWVKSTTTGTYSGHIGNGISGSFRTYIFNYTISSANTWERKTITITGDTTGTWYKDNRVGLKVLFSIGTGGGEGTLNTWAGADNVKTTGSTGLDNITSASWQITGVQLEVGSVATPFTTATGTIQGELAACERYYYKFPEISNYQYGAGFCFSTTQALIPMRVPTTMRGTPTITLSAGNTFQVYSATGTQLATTAVSSTEITVWGFRLTATVASGLVAGNGTSLHRNSSSVEVSAEL